MQKLIQWIRRKIRKWIGKGGVARDKNDPKGPTEDIYPLF
jgi:hypothetical protein